MRTIDADRLKRSFEANTPIAFQDCVPGIHAIIDLEPTVDAKPVRHGHWIRKGLRWHCSACGYGAFNSDFVFGARYCPTCGARMDERTEE